MPSQRRPHTQSQACLSIQGQVPVRTFGEWKNAAPGSLQADLVAHWGEFLNGVLFSWCQREGVRLRFCGPQARRLRQQIYEARRVLWRMARKADGSLVWAEPAEEPKRLI